MEQVSIVKRAKFIVCTIRLIPLQIAPPLMWQQQQPDILGQAMNLASSMAKIKKGFVSEKQLIISLYLLCFVQVGRKRTIKRKRLATFEKFNFFGNMKLLEFYARNTNQCWKKLYRKIIPTQLLILLPHNTITENALWRREKYFPIIIPI